MEKEASDRRRAYPAAIRGSLAALLQLFSIATASAQERILILPSIDESQSGRFSEAAAAVDDALRTMASLSPGVTYVEGKRAGPKDIGEAILKDAKASALAMVRIRESASAYAEFESIVFRSGQGRASALPPFRPVSFLAALRSVPEIARAALEAAKGAPMDVGGIALLGDPGPYPYRISVDGVVVENRELLRTIPSGKRTVEIVQERPFGSVRLFGGAVPVEPGRTASVELDAFGLAEKEAERLREIEVRFSLESRTSAGAGDVDAAFEEYLRVAAPFAPYRPFRERLPAVSAERDRWNGTKPLFAFEGITKDGLLDIEAALPILERETARSGQGSPETKAALSGAAALHILRRAAAKASSGDYAGALADYRLIETHPAAFGPATADVARREAAVLRDLSGAAAMPGFRMDEASRTAETAARREAVSRLAAAAFTRRSSIRVPAPGPDTSKVVPDDGIVGLGPEARKLRSDLDRDLKKRAPYLFPDGENLGFFDLRLDPGGALTVGATLTAGISPTRNLTLFVLARSTEYSLILDSGPYADPVGRTEALASFGGGIAFYRPFRPTAVRTDRLRFALFYENIRWHLRSVPEDELAWDTDVTSHVLAVEAAYQYRSLSGLRLELGVSLGVAPTFGKAAIEGPNALSVEYPRVLPFAAPIIAIGWELP